jgi:hypothetical protein
MGNLNKDNQGVFINIAGDTSSIPDYEQFINRPSQDLHPEYCLANYITEYSTKVQQHKLDIEQLAHLEKIIMQIRALSNLTGNVKLYTVRDTYIYARCPFHRNESEVNEVRLLIDPIDLHFPTGKAGTADLKILSDKKDFMDKVYDKMKIVMRAEINGNITDYKKIYSKNIL